MNEHPITCYDSWISIVNLLILVILPLLISISDVTLTYQNVNNTCQNTDPINLTSWIYVSSGITFISAFTNISISFLIARMDINVKIVMIIAFVVQLFMFIWNIVGTVEFFLQMKSCPKMRDLLVSLMWATLTSQWVMFIVFILVATFILVKINKKKSHMQELKNLIERTEKNDI